MLHSSFAVFVVTGMAVETACGRSGYFERIVSLGVCGRVHILGAKSVAEDGSVGMQLHYSGDAHTLGFTIQDW